MRIPKKIKSKDINATIKNLCSNLKDMDKIFADLASILAKTSTAVLLEDSITSNKTCFTIDEIQEAASLKALLAAANSQTLTAGTKGRVVQYFEYVGIKDPTVEIDTVDSSSKDQHMAAYAYFTRELDAAQAA